MISEEREEVLFVEACLEIIKNPEHKTNVEKFCKEYHIDRNKLTSGKLFSTYTRTLNLLMIGIAQIASFEEYISLCTYFSVLNYYVANSYDGTSEAIINAHAGSPIKKKH